ncbi:MFS transporter [Starkeya sp. ORNL1]|uniref:MFS transporter n=1 Tax=Starkeya sp. ORNL1 TaxID=2709380 RepID=UPI0014644E74|nr:MFS transporter [Starkeya sp. ORNL1]QJP15886.1 MFS transporter [Starkeya sp. ORNL1]
MLQPGTSAAPRATRREWIGLAVIALPCLVYSMDLTVLNLAVPHLALDLAPSAAQLLWIIDIYGFLLAGALIVMGTLGDRIGRRRLLLIGAAAFAFASTLAAFATSAATLIAARALLGIAGATLAPSTLSLIRNMFLDDRQRTFAIGVWIACFSAGAAIGPLIGGAVLAHFWWGAVFLLGVPVMLLLLVLGPFLLPEYRDDHAGRMDILSAVQSVIAVLAVIYGVKRIAEDGLGSESLFAILIGIAVGALFVRRQHRLADPLIDLGLFRDPAIGTALTVNMLALFSAMGIFLFISQYLQLVIGMGPFEAGLWTAPSGLAFITGSLGTPFVVRFVRPVYVVVGGLLLATLGFALMTQMDPAAPLPVLVPAIVMFCLGLSPVGTLTTDLVMRVAPPERAGAVSAISETSFEFGAALGIAVLGSIVAALYRLTMADIALDVPADALAAARRTLDGAVVAAGKLSPEIAAPLLAAAHGAFAHALVIAATVCAGVTAFAAGLAALMLRRVGS